jgi:hypothetical protein
MAGSPSMTGRVDDRLIERTRRRLDHDAVDEAARV